MSDPTLRSVLARFFHGYHHPAVEDCTLGQYTSVSEDGGKTWHPPDYAGTRQCENEADAMLTDPALAAAERVLAAAVEWERGRLDDTEAFVTLVEAVHAYRSVVEGR